VELRQQLDKAREAGLLSQGANWTLNVAGARSFTKQLTPEIDQAKSVERMLGQLRPLGAAPHPIVMVPFKVIVSIQIPGLQQTANPCGGRA
jgi:hypothetical protein